MRDKFIEISLNDLVAKDLLYQHDKGQVIRFVEEIGDGTLVLFNNSNIKEDAVPRYIENCSVEIPDRLLEAEGSLVVTVKLVDSNSETTQKVIKIKIKSGSKQNEEIEPENQQTFIEQIQDIMTTTKSIAEDVQKRADNGEFDGKDGYTPVKGKDYFTDAEVNQIKNDTREQVVTEITPSLENNLKSAKDYTDNAIIRDFKDITYDETTATFIFTRHDDTTFTVDLPIEQTVKDGRYDDETAELVLVLVSGQEIRIPVTGLIDDYTGVDSATIQVVISADNKITCNIIGGTISKTLLTTELQAEIDGKANRSEMSNLVQEVGGKLLELATTDKESYVAAINELKGDLADYQLCRQFDFSNLVDGSFIDKFGKKIDGHNSYSITQPFHIYKNETVIFKATGYKTNVSMISRHSNGKYSPLVISRSTNREIYVYTATDDIDIVLSFNNRSTYQCTVGVKVLELYNKNKTELETIIDSNFIEGRVNFFEGVKSSNNCSMTDGVITTLQLQNYQGYYINCTYNSVSSVQNLGIGTYYINFKHKLNSGTSTKFANKVDIIYKKSDGSVASITASPVKGTSVSNEYKYCAYKFTLNEEVIGFGIYVQVVGTDVIFSLKDIVVSTFATENYYSYTARQVNDENVYDDRIEDLQKIGTKVEGNISDIENIKTQLGSKYKFAKVAILGDSMSTFQNYIKNGDIYYYPYRGNDVTDVSHTWWYKVIDSLGANLLINDSSSGSAVSLTPSYSDNEHAFVNRMKTNLGQNNITGVKPDVIFIFGGTNDGNAPSGDYIYSDWTDDDLKNFAPAFAYMIDYLMKWNPFAKIYVITQNYLDTRRKDIISTVCEHYGISNIVTSSYSATDGHPNIAGMTTIANDITNFIENE